MCEHRGSAMSNWDVACMVELLHGVDAFEWPGRLEPAVYEDVVQGFAVDAP
jgi:hypothetical protein